MLAGCRPSVPPTETTNEMTDEATNGQPDTTDIETGPDTVLPELIDQTVALPYTVTTVHQAGDKIFAGTEWTGTLSPSVGGTKVRQTEVFCANRMAPHSSETLFYQSAEAARLGAVNFDYAKSTYSNTIYPRHSFDENKEKTPEAPTALTPVGFYRTSFTVDERWLESDRSVYIAFGGVESCYYVWVNGYEVGYAESSYDLAEFDLTPYLFSNTEP